MVVVFIDKKFGMLTCPLLWPLMKPIGEKIGQSVRNGSGRKQHQLVGQDASSSVE